jgi:hypothetical protein
MLQTWLVWAVVTMLYGVLGSEALAMFMTYFPHSRPDSAADSAELTLCWFDASCAFVAESVAIETAKAENMTTNIIDRMSTAPGRLE